MAYVTNNGAVVTTSDSVDANDVVYLGGIAIRKSDGAMHVTSGLSSTQLAALAASGLTAKTGGVVVLGDSITAYGVASTATSSTYTARNWAEIAMGINGYRQPITAHKGVTGDTFALMHARFATDVTPYYPSIVVVEGGSNDADGGRTAAQMFADLMTLYADCKAINAQMWYVGTIHDRNSTPHNVPLSQLFDMCSKASRVLKGFKFFDIFEAIVDYGSGKTVANVEQGQSVSGALADGTHPAAYGAYLIGSKLATFSLPYLPYTKDQSSLHRSDFGTSQYRLCFNGLMMGNGGTVQGVGAVTGSAPDSWSITRSGSITGLLCTQAARTDGGPGRIMRIPLASAAAVTDFVRAEMNPGEDISAWIGYSASTQVEVNATASGGTIGLVRVTTDFLASNGSTVLMSAVGNDLYQAGEYMGVTAYSRIIRTPTVTIPASTKYCRTRIEVFTSIGATGNLDVMSCETNVDVWTSALTASLP